MPGRKAGYVAVTDNSENISGLNNRGLILTHVKSFIGPTDALGSCPLYVGSALPGYSGLVALRH